MLSDYEKIDYYNVGIECIDIIEGLNLHFSCGNAFKYLYRSNNIRPKGEVLDDLNKALYYLNRMLNKPRLNSSTKTQKYVEGLDESLFTNPIYDAIKYTLQAGTSSDLESYRYTLYEAIKAIEYELFN